MLPMNTKFFREEVEAAVDALLLQQTLLYPAGPAGWALGCDAELPRAVEQLYQLPARPAGASAVVLVADAQMLARYAAEVPVNFSELIATHSQPTAFVVAGSRHLAPNLLEPDGTVQLHVVQDEFCHRVIRRLGHGLVSLPAIQSQQAEASGRYADVAPALVRAVGHVVTWQQEGTISTEPWRVVRLVPDGTT